jgi:hypothetical protein
LLEHGQTYVATFQGAHAQESYQLEATASLCLL